MPFCKHCGEEIFENIPHECKAEIEKDGGNQAGELTAALLNVKNILKSLWQKMTRKIGVSDTDTDYYESGKQIIPDSIAAENGETIIKQYDNLAVLQSKIKLTRAKGRMQITNKRVVFRANGFSPAGKITYQQEFSLDKIEGVSIRKDYRFRFIDCLFMDAVATAIISIVTRIGAGVPYFIMAIIGIVSWVPFFLLKKQWLKKLLILSIGAGFLISGVIRPSGFAAVLSIISVFLYLIALFLYALKPNLLIEFKVGGAEAIQIRRKDSIFSFKHEEYSGFAEVMPGKDAELAIKEVGAIIDDIKTLGDLGVEKWRTE